MSAPPLWFTPSGFLDEMMKDDAHRFFIAARMRAYGAHTLKEFLLMQRNYSLKGLAEKIECPTLVCDNVADTPAGGQAKRLYETLNCPKDYSSSSQRRGLTATGKAELRFSSIARSSTGWIRGWHSSRSSPRRTPVIYSSLSRDTRARVRKVNFSCFLKGEVLTYPLQIFVGLS
jgi:hypothetical protein